MSDNKTSARVIRIGLRYFHGFSATRRVQISPYLAGAKLYFPDISDIIDRDLLVLRKKGWSGAVHIVDVRLEAAQ